MKLLTAVIGLALALPGGAQAARFAVGVAPKTDAAALAARLEARTGGSTARIGPFAVELQAPTAHGVARMKGVTYVERITARRRVAFVPTDPLFGKQWYATSVRAFDAWTQRPYWLSGVKVAVIDSGIDGEHPEFRGGRIAAANTFVGGSAYRDTQGHGTFVAGLIAARMDNAEGIAGLAFPARLLVAKVVRSDGAVPLDAEARAIRWAVDRGAKVINLSLGGVRDPMNPNHDSYSSLEASAIQYAVRRGAVVVAAVGNSELAPDKPWPYASYPAALPHVLGVSALGRDGGVPMFSNRDPIYNDIAAPGDDLFSTIPRVLSAPHPTCVEPGYSDCGPPEYRRPQGTSFAAAIVSAGAALVRSAWPTLTADQVVYLLERSSVDQTPATGCRRCTDNRDSLTGWGRLDVATAVDPHRAHPALDKYETNDDAGTHAWRVDRRRATLRASIDYWDDQNDVYSVYLRKGQRLRAVLNGTPGTDVNLVIWKPGTRRLDELRYPSSRFFAKASRRPGAKERLRYRADRKGRYFVQVKISAPGAGGYKLQLFR
jgi:subtilisin family serine protease